VVAFFSTFPSVFFYKWTEFSFWTLMNSVRSMSMHWRMLFTDLINQQMHFYESVQSHIIIIIIIIYRIYKMHLLVYHISKQHPLKHRHVTYRLNAPTHFTSTDCVRVYPQIVADDYKTFWYRLVLRLPAKMCTEI
jgi:hypothetical protein